jgi:hypothetical protein
LSSQKLNQSTTLQVCLTTVIIFTPRARYSLFYVSSFLRASPTAPFQVAHRNSRHHFSYVEERKIEKRRDYLLSPYFSCSENEVVCGTAPKEWRRKEDVK